MCSKFSCILHICLVSGGGKKDCRLAWQPDPVANAATAPETEQVPDLQVTDYKTEGFLCF